MGCTVSCGAVRRTKTLGEHTTCRNNTATVRKLKEHSDWRLHSSSSCRNPTRLEDDWPTKTAAPSFPSERFRGAAARLLPELHRIRLHGDQGHPSDDKVVVGMSTPATLTVTPSCPHVARRPQVGGDQETQAPKKRRRA